MSHPKTRRMRFVGVSTASSSIMKVFPLWSDILGLDAELVGLDIPLDAPASAYREAVATIQGDPSCAGALFCEGNPFMKKSDPPRTHAVRTARR